MDDHDTPQWALKDVCAQTGVTARTVRYYIQQGLLPSAERTGPGVRYSDAFVHRLELIGRLKTQHLPLAAIRERIESLDGAAIRELLETSAEPPSTSSARDYIRQVLADQGPSKPRSPPRQMAMMRSPSPPARPEPRAPERSRWDRITVDRDIELHVRRPLSRTKQKQLDVLLDLAHSLFASGDTP